MENTLEKPLVWEASIRFITSNMRKGKDGWALQPRRNCRQTEGARRHAEIKKNKTQQNKKKHDLTEVGCVYSVQEETGGRGEKPNECDINVRIHEKFKMQNYKNTIVGKAALIWRKRMLFDSCGNLLFIPRKGTVRGKKNISRSFLSWLKEVDSKFSSGLLMDTTTNLTQHKKNSA